VAVGGRRGVRRRWLGPDRPRPRSLRVTDDVAGAGHLDVGWDVAGAGDVGWDVAGAGDLDVGRLLEVRRGDELKRALADLDLVAGGQWPRVRDPLAVEEGAVGGVE